MNQPFIPTRIITDFIEMEDAIELLCDFDRLYQDIENRIFSDGIEFIAYKKSFIWGRKPVAKLKVELIRDVQFEPMISALDYKFLTITLNDANGKKEVISNYGLLKDFVRTFRGNIENMYADGFNTEFKKELLALVSDSTSLESIASNYEKVIKWIDVFENIIFIPPYPKRNLKDLHNVCKDVNMSLADKGVKEHFKILKDIDTPTIFHLVLYQLDTGEKIFAAEGLTVDEAFSWMCGCANAMSYMYRKKVKDGL